MIEETVSFQLSAFGRRGLGSAARLNGQVPITKCRLLIWLMAILNRRSGFTMERDGDQDRS